MHIPRDGKSTSVPLGSLNMIRSQRLTKDLVMMFKRIIAHDMIQTQDMTIDPHQALVKWKILEQKFITMKQQGAPIKDLYEISRQMFNLSACLDDIIPSIPAGYEPGQEEYDSLSKVARWDEDEDSLDGGREQAGIGDDAGTGSGIEGQDVMPINKIEDRLSRLNVRRTGGEDKLSKGHIEILKSIKECGHCLPDVKKHYWKAWNTLKRGPEGFADSNNDGWFLTDKGHKALENTRTSAQMPERSIDGAPIEEGTGHLPIVDACKEVESVIDSSAEEVMGKHHDFLEGDNPSKKQLKKDWKSLHK